MSKKVINKYIFTPGAAGVGTVKVPGKVSLERFILITNSTTNAIIYSFVENGLGGTASYNASDTSTFSNVIDGVTTLTLAANTSSMSSSHKLTIMVDEDNVKVRPYDFGTDAVERMRVANPQSMLDADFEYGLQPTKWLALSLMRNYPSFYEIPGSDLTITAITTNGSNPSLITVSTAENHNLNAGDPINVQGLSRLITGFSKGQGSFVANSVPTTNTLNYFAKGTVGTNGQSLLTDGIQLRKGGFYTAAPINVSTMYSSGANPSTITVVTGTKHGLLPGTPIAVNMTGGSTNYTYGSGAYYVESITDAYTFSYTARSGAAVANSSLTANVYVRPESYFIHRPFDGGVIVGTGSPAVGAQAIRGSKKYFRYQSGKGLFFSTGTVLKPNYDIQSVTSTGTTVGSTITVATDGVDHGLNPGATVLLSGITTPGYNGSYTVYSVDTDTTFQVISTSSLASTTASLDLSPKVYVTAWNGSSVRIGPFDDQNGMFWEFDGANLNAVVRNSVLQIAGTVSATPDNNTISGTNTRFVDQLRVGDDIVIRGMTHTVTAIDSQTSMSVVPDFRGVSSVSGVRVCLVRETRVPSSQFNVDTLDGNGPSGYNIDLNKMQMLALQYTWYGAGFIDFMCRGPNGNFIVAHRIKNNNVNNESFMRSGNLPVRYSIINDGARTYLSGDITSSNTSLTVSDASRYPNSGTIYIDNEIISYSGKTSNTLTGLSRAATFTTYTGGTSRSFTAGAAAAHTASTTIYLLNINCSPTLSHWGSAYIMDGNFDTDRGYIFNTQKLSLAVTATNQTAFLIRLSPSVSNGLVGDLGVKDLINRAQLLLTSLEVTAGSAAPLVIEGILNPLNYPTNPSNITWQGLGPVSYSGQPSLAQIAQGSTVSWASGSYATPGETIFSFISAGSDTKTLDLSALKELTSTPIGGRGTFPNGPDVLAINVRTITGSATAHLVLRWSEAQA